MTTTRIRTIIGEILSNLRKILCVSIILPTPPAPTNPRITLALIPVSYTHLTLPTIDRV